MKDYVIEGNTYEMSANEITQSLRNLYMASGEITEDLSTGTLFDELFEFCIGALEVYYAVF